MRFGDFGEEDAEAASRVAEHRVKLRELAEPLDDRDVMIEAMLQSATRSAELAEATGMRHDRIILSAKVSGVRDLVVLRAYQNSAISCLAP